MGGKTIRPRKFSAPPKNKPGKKCASVDNRQHLRLGLLARSLQRPRAHAQLRRVTQPWTLADIFKWSNETCRRFLVKHGVLPGPRESYVCWECGSRMRQASGASSSSGQPVKNVVECSKCRTKSRHALQMSQAHLAYTPFWAAARRGYEPEFDVFLRVAFCVGIRMPMDSMQHVLPEKHKPVSERQIDKFHHQCRFVLAFAQQQQAGKVSLAFFQKHSSSYFPSNV